MIDRPPGPLDLRISVGPFPITVEPTFWLIMALFGYQPGLPGHYLVGWVFLGFVAILTHELGHAVAIHAFGGAAGIRLYSFGGLTFPDRTFSRGQSIIVSLAGPATGLVLGGLISLLDWLYPPQTGLWRYLVHAGKFVTLGWSLLNLIPVMPLDGGHVLAAALGPARLRLSLLLAGLAGAGAAVYFARTESTYAAVLFAFLGLRNFMTWSELKALETRKRTVAGQPVAAEPQVALRAWELLHRGDEREARRIATRALEATRPSAQRNDLLDVLAWVELAEGELAAAQLHLDQVSPRDAVRPLSQALLQEARGGEAQALPLAILAFAQEPSDTSASLAVRLSLKAGTLEEAERIVQAHAWKNSRLSDSLSAQIALRRSDFPLAARLAEAAFVAGKRAQDALNAARATASAGDLARATLWIKHALDSGFEDLESIEQEAELLPVLALPEVATRLRALRGA
ncbi:MAG: hypothetical protein M3Y59_23405 [Myxococcota bacterium]|nr:hypothetical protein [Myxococcota bacterium]